MPPLSVTFEVLFQKDGQWQSVASLDTRNEAESLAKDFFGQPNIEAVKVMKKSGGQTDEMIFHREVQKQNEPKVGSINTAPFCTNLTDIYGLDSRRTIGRLLRKQLDQQHMMPIELLHDAKALHFIKNQNLLWDKACHRVANIQCTNTKNSEQERFENLLLMTNEVLVRAKNTPESDKLSEMIESKGYAATLAACDDSWSEEYTVITLGRALAHLLKKGNGYAEKADIILETLGKDGHVNTHTVCDELLAELLDSTLSIDEIISTSNDLAGILLTIGELVQNNILEIPQRRQDSTLAKLNRALMQYSMPKTQESLLGKMAILLRSKNPLTSNNDEQSGKLYEIMSTLFRPWGIAGGSTVAGAILRRSQMALTPGGENRSLGETIQALTILFSSAGARLGFIMSLGTDPLFKDKNTSPILTQVLTEALLAVPSQQALVSAKETQFSCDDIAERLRVMSQSFPYWSQVSPQAREHFLSLAGGMATQKTMGEAATNKAPSSHKICVEPGDYLFMEGEVGDAAYLISSGLVDIFLDKGGSEHLVATVGQGEIIGEMALIDNSPRMASARARTKVETIAVPQAALQKRLTALEENDGVMRKLVDTWIKRLRS